MHTSLYMSSSHQESYRYAFSASLVGGMNGSTNASHVQFKFLNMNDLVAWS
jgi:hypothetical protein